MRHVTECLWDRKPHYTNVIKSQCFVLFYSFKWLESEMDRVLLSSFTIQSFSCGVLVQKYKMQQHEKTTTMAICTHKYMVNMCMSTDRSRERERERGAHSSLYPQFYESLTHTLLPTTAASLAVHWQTREVRCVLNYALWLSKILNRMVQGGYF